MSDSINTTIASNPDRIRLLAPTPTHDLLQAIVAPISTADPQSLLESLASWQQSRSSALSVDEREHGSGSGLWGAAREGTLHDEVDHFSLARVARGRGRRHRRDVVLSITGKTSRGRISIRRCGQTASEDLS